MQQKFIIRYTCLLARTHVSSSKDKTCESHFWPQGMTQKWCLLPLPMVDWKRQLTQKLFFQIFFSFSWGALPPRPPGFWLGGQRPPEPPLKRSFVTFDRGGQTGPPRSNDFLFGAADDTCAADNRPPAVRRPSTGRPTTVHGTNGPTVPSFSA